MEIPEEGVSNTFLLPHAPSREEGREAQVALLFPSGLRGLRWLDDPC